METTNQPTPTNQQQIQYNFCLLFSNCQWVYYAWQLL